LLPQIEHWTLIPSRVKLEIAERRYVILINGHTKEPYFLLDSAMRLPVGMTGDCVRTAVRRVSNKFRLSALRA